jgi:hypothetical protein
VAYATRRYVLVVLVIAVLSVTALVIKALVPAAAGDASTAPVKSGADVVPPEVVSFASSFANSDWCAQDSGQVDTPGNEASTTLASALAMIGNDPALQSYAKTLPGNTPLYDFALMGNCSVNDGSEPVKVLTAIEVQILAPDNGPLTLVGMRGQIVGGPALGDPFGPQWSECQMSADCK